MKSMKLTKKQQEGMTVPVAAEPEKPEYPYGLCLRLGREELMKLGIKQLPQVGDSFVVDAKCVVKGVSAGDGDGGKYASCDLQITDMGMEGDDEARRKDTAKKMYDKMGEKK